jgi:hypothetical protein
MVRIAVTTRLHTKNALENLVGSHLSKLGKPHKGKRLSNCQLMSVKDFRIELVLRLPRQQHLKEKE